jgi:hypothetical protein
MRTLTFVDVVDYLVKSLASLSAMHAQRSRNVPGRTTQGDEKSLG